MFYNSITDILLVTEPVYDHLCFIASENNLILASAELDYGNYSVLFMLKIYLFSCMYTEFSGWDIAILSKQQDNPEGSKWCFNEKKRHSLPQEHNWWQVQTGTYSAQTKWALRITRCKPHLCFCPTNL